MQTHRDKYLEVSVTIAKNKTSFADYPNTKETICKVSQRGVRRTARVLQSDKRRYRIYYKKNELSKLFDDIENIMSE